MLFRSLYYGVEVKRNDGWDLWTWNAPLDSPCGRWSNPKEADEYVKEHHGAIGRRPYRVVEFISRPWAARPAPEGPYAMRTIRDYAVVIDEGGSVQFTGSPTQALAVRDALNREHAEDHHGA